MKTTDYIRSLDNLIVYWINLDISVKRRKYMKQVLQDPVFKRIPVERISAFDADKDDIYEKLIITKPAPHMTPSVYGCLISHLDTIHAFSKSEYEFALILEDDVSLEFKPFWKKPLDIVIKDSPSDWEVLQLGYGLNDPNHFPKMEYTPMSIGNYYQNVAYLISKKGARRLINEIYVGGKYRLYNNICQEADNFLFNAFRTYTYKYPYFTNNTTLISTIKNNMRSEKLRYSKLSKEVIRKHFFRKKTVKKGTNLKRVKWQATRCIHGKRKIGFILDTYQQ